MGNLIRAEWYRFWKYPAFRHLGIVTCFITALFLVWSDWLSGIAYTYTGFDAVRQLYSGYATLLYFFVIPVLIYTVCASFRNKTVYHEQLAGHNSHTILLSRLIVGVGLTVIISLACIALIIGFITWENGWFNSTKSPSLTDYIKRPADYFYGIIVFLFAIAQAAAICILLTCLTQEPVSALLLSWGLSLLPYVVNEMRPYSSPVERDFGGTMFPGFQPAMFGSYLFSSNRYLWEEDIYVIYTGEVPLSFWCVSILLFGLLELTVLYAIVRIVIKKRQGLER